MQTRIPFNKPFIAGNELKYIAEAVQLGNISGDGAFTQACAEILERRLGIGRVLMTPSCTAALEMAVMLCDVGPGDEVIMPSFTFVSTANAVVLRGGKPIFVDIRPDTLNLDESLLADAITERTKAIFPVHYAGVACEMQPILELAGRHDLLVVEDAAQGVNAWYRERALGSLAPLAAFSFHETKNYICGEGGALCINDERLVPRAEILRDKGTNRRQFFRGEVDKYTWVDIGSSYVPSEIACAFLYGQLELLDPIAERRRKIHEFYDEQFQPLAERGLLRTPRVPADCRSNFHLFYILLPDGATRDSLLLRLRERQIHAVFHYVPLHTSPMGLAMGYREGQLPNTERLSARLLRLPLYYDITRDQQQYVVDCVREFLEHPP